MLSTIRKISALFEARERWSVIGLAAGIIAVALIQTVGVASIMPFMSLVANPEMIAQNEWVSVAYDRLGFESTRSFLIFAGIVVLAIMALSNASAAFEQWLMLRFIWTKQHRLSVRLLRRYLGAPYTYYLNQNTASLAKNVLAEISEVINGVLMPLMRALAQTVIVVFIFGLLVSVDVVVAVTAAVVMGGTYGMIFIVVRRRQARLGRVRRKTNSLRFKTAAEALGSVKETKILGRESEFLRRFSIANERYSDANASNAMMSEIPRYALETLAFGGILLIVLYLLHTRDNFGEAVAVVSLYAVAGYRLMPALQTIFRGVTKTRFFLPALNSLYADLIEGAVPVEAVDRSRPVTALAYEQGIVFDDVAYRYPGTDVDVVNNINLEIPKNTAVAFVGSTGCGKTTALDLLLGLLEPREGSIRIDGVALNAGNIATWRKRVGYIPQHIFLCDDTIRRNIAFGVPDEEIEDTAVQRAARIAHLHEFIQTLPRGYDTVVGERGVRLSGGQRQRIGIARALYADPEVLIMDEATSALDGITEDAVIQAIRDLSGQKTIILVAHRLTTVRACNAIYVFDRGEIVASGQYGDLLESNVQFRAMARAGSTEPAVA